jgi:DNA-binding NarL/FixJ family response regulator
VSHQVMVFAALTESYESLLAEVTAHQSADPEYCPFCGSLLDNGLTPNLEATLPSHIADALMRTPTLSPRELDVFELLGLGYDNRTLARALLMSERTVKRHVTSILAKLGLTSRLQAGLVALLTSSLRPGGPKVAWTDSAATDDTCD